MRYRILANGSRTSGPLASSPAAAQASRLRVAAGRRHGSRRDAGAPKAPRGFSTPLYLLASRETLGGLKARRSTSHAEVIIAMRGASEARRRKW